MIGKSVAKFPLPESVGKREWGEEILLASIPDNLTLKTIVMKKGSLGGLQYHQMKSEAGILISGKLEIRFENDKGILDSKIIYPGDVFYFPVESVHQEIALEDSVIIEASTPYLNDRVRVEDAFGEDSSTGLPSTSIDEIIKI